MTHKSIVENTIKVLNKRQKEAVFCKENLLVLAGAGSGKTTVVTIKVANDVINNGVNPHGVLCITFTNKASKEMKSRICSLIPNGKSVNVSTFHSWCASFLRLHAAKVGRTKKFIIVDDDDVKKLIKLFCSDERVESLIGFSSLDHDEILYKIKSLKEGETDFEISDKAISSLTDAEKYVLNAYECKLHYMNAIDFTDMIRYATAIMKSNHELIPVYERVFIDEFQDTNDSQFKMVELIGEKSSVITAVGDDDQSIYEWRGAKPSNMSLFIENFNAGRIDLEENYRSTNTIVDAANQLISYNVNRLGKVMRPVKKGDNKINVVKTMNQETESEFISTLIDDYLYKNESKSVGILYRNNRYSRRIEMSLRRRGINYKLTKGLEFTKRREIALAFRFLRLASNPRDIVSLDCVMSHFVDGVGPKSIMKINSSIESLDIDSIYSGKGVPLKGEQLSKYIWIMNLAKRVNELPLSEVGSAIGAYFIPTDDIYISPTFNIDLFSDGCETTIDDINFKERSDVCRIRLKGKFCQFKGDAPEQFEDRTGNLDELIYWLDEFSQKNSSASLSDFLQESSIDASDKDNKEEARVNLMTVHSSKGLEFDMVYIIGCINGFFPGLREGEESNLEESRRLMYVAVTRAKDILTITVPEEVNSRFNDPRKLNPSIFISEMKGYTELKDLGRKAKAMNSIYGRV